MSELAIRAETLSKRYRIGQRDPYRTLRGALAQAAVAPLRRLRSGFQPSKDNFSQNGTIWALKEVSFEIEKGEVVGVIGRNGAGKSTLLKILSRITRPTKGRAEIHGRVGSLLEVGTGFNPELTGRENIYLNGAILGMKRKEMVRKFDEIVAFAELEAFLDTPIKRYSSGMYMRLAFSVAAYLEPDILLVDEVLAVGDAGFQKKCLGKMGNVAREGRTVLFVSHNMTAVQALCERSVWIEKGQVRADGASREVIDRHLASIYTGSQLHPGEVDLHLRQNEYFPGQTIIQRLSFFNSDGCLQDTFLMGGEIQVAVDVKEFSSYRDASIEVTFRSEGNQQITRMNTAMACAPVIGSRGEEERAILRVPRIPFTPGTYWIDISVSQHDGSYLDFIERAASFTVAEADVYGSGYQVCSSFGLVYLEGSWEIMQR